MDRKLEPLIPDKYAGDNPLKRVLAYVESQVREGKKVVGLYCGYAPVELIHAASLVPVTLCAFSNAPIEKAEVILPANLCPLIKSSFGFIMTDTCPFFALSEVVIGETTCDGKKKVFELISRYKPIHVMELPQFPESPRALKSWVLMIKELKAFIETYFKLKISDEDIEAAIADSNLKTKMMNQIFEYLALDPPVIHWEELDEVLFLGLSCKAKDMVGTFETIIEKLEARKNEGYFREKQGSPRVMITGCPVAGDALKVFRAVDRAGGVIVALEACSGMKPYMSYIEEGTGDPIMAIAKRYLRIPCSCMTPNDGRLRWLDHLINRFKPHAVIDVILHACHTYNVESYKVGEYIQKEHGLPFLKIVTDYSQNDTEQIATRIEALLDILR